jgi:hypothetical protein
MKNAISTTKKYWYREPWHGEWRSFACLRDAKKAAATEPAYTITIYECGTYTFVCDVAGRGPYA